MHGGRGGRGGDIPEAVEGLLRSFGTGLLLEEGLVVVGGDGCGVHGGVLVLGRVEHVEGSF